MGIYYTLDLISKDFVGVTDRELDVTGGVVLIDAVNMCVDGVVY